MTTDEALQILDAVDWESSDRFTPEQHAAVVKVVAEKKLGHLSKQQIKKLDSYLKKPSMSGSIH